MDYLRKSLIFCLKIFAFPFLLILSCIWAFVAFLRNKFYCWNIFKQASFNKIKIISVGNITVGGTGKTPFIEYLIKLFENQKIAVLSRGYKRKTKGFRIVKLSDTATAVGDEPLQIKIKFPNITVAVSEDRVLGVEKLLKIDDFNLILLDDAFQHRRIKPDVNILLSSYWRPFFRDWFLPLGRLRDNVSQYKRADFIIFTKCPKNLSDIEKTKILKNIKFPEQRIFFTTIQYGKPYNYLGERIDFQDFRNKRLILITGIASAEQLVNFIENYTKIIYHFNYSDHYNFKEKDIFKFLRKAEKQENTIFLTTEKDFVRLKDLHNFNLIAKKLYIIPIEIKFLERETQFKSMLFAEVELNKN